MQNDTLSSDIIIFGGGVAGLWLLNLLSAAGYSVLLFETGALGGSQTLASQGMVHGGIKYALGGALSGASETIGAMPDRWRQCLAGEGSIDLSNVAVLSEDFYLWSSASLTSKFTAFAASKALRGRIQRLSNSEWPLIFQHHDFNGHVYRLHDPVLDTVSLVQQLAAPYQNRIFKIDWQQARLHRDPSGQRLQYLQLQTPAGSLRISAQLFLATAGAGNASIIAAAGAEKPAMQRRALHQVALTKRGLPTLYAHALGTKSSPRVTVSTHFLASGQPLWYLGGDLATEGVQRSPAQQIAFAQQELASLVPWVDLNQAEWRSFSIDRAEPWQSQLLKPDDAFAEYATACANLLVCWPIKLTLTPRLGDIVLAKLNRSALQPLQPDGKEFETFTSRLPTAKTSTPIWDALFEC